MATDLTGEIPHNAVLPDATVDELVTAFVSSSRLSGAFVDAIKAQAKKYKLKPKALRTYITALANDNLEDKRAETQQLSDLIG